MESSFDESETLPSTSPECPTRTGTPVAASSLLALPDSLDCMRLRIFKLDEEVVMTAAEFDLYWLYFDNIFKLNQSRPSKKTPSKVTKHWQCRLHESGAYIPRIEKMKRQRNCTARIRIACPWRMRSVHDGISVSIKRTSAEGHNHEYDYLKFKNSSAVRKVMGTEVERGYRTCDIANN